MLAVKASFRIGTLPPGPPKSCPQDKLFPFTNRFSINSLSVCARDLFPARMLIKIVMVYFLACFTLKLGLILGIGV